MTVDLSVYTNHCAINLQSQIQAADLFKPMASLLLGVLLKGKIVCVLSDKVHLQSITRKKHATKMTDASTQSDLTGDGPRHYQTLTHSTQKPNRRNYHHSRKSKKNNKKKQDQEPESKGIYDATDEAFTAEVAKMRISAKQIPFLQPDHPVAIKSAASFSTLFDSGLGSATARAVKDDLEEAERYFGGMRKALEARLQLSRELEWKMRELNMVVGVSGDGTGSMEAERERVVEQVKVLRARWIAGV
ncbi:hypothetical protein H2198_006368 [Neophaeococcomyces mojaviensis]|uniref:Uncharacterized protein n=1 Tax=Neophaeococcomyces mojaviensis TaxID=3383035 RepID=A0ACC3A369_9EURO|nr:hypothetical protein H2198_006368 [Knufia sp. JES_112]